MNPIIYIVLYGKTAKTFLAAFDTRDAAQEAINITFSNRPIKKRMCWIEEVPLLRVADHL